MTFCHDLIALLVQASRCNAPILARGHHHQATSHTQLQGISCRDTSSHQSAAIRSAGLAERCSVPGAGDAIQIVQVILAVPAPSTNTAHTTAAQYSRRHTVHLS